MKFMQCMRLIVLIFFYSTSLLAEGFAVGTLIKVPRGYAKIEELRVGDCIVSCDAHGMHVEGNVICISKKSLESYARISIADNPLSSDLDQRLYDEINGVWIDVAVLKSESLLSGNLIEVELINEPIDVYLLSVAPQHNFLVTKQDICAHNVFPVAIGFSLAFGAGSVELASIGATIAGLGGFLSYQWHKKSKQKHAIGIQLQCAGNQMMPEDPEEKKRKRDEAREEYRPLTNKEARIEAEKLGYRETKDHPCGYTYDKPVFTNGKNYISPDKYGHRGGVWKVFDRSGERLETVNIDLTIIIGK